MALSAANRADIRYFLGWPARWFQSDSRLEQAMNALDSLTAQDSGATETLVLACVTSAKAIDTALVTAWGRIKALKVGSIDLPGAMEVETLRREGRRFVGRLAAILGVHPVADVFGSGAGAGSNEIRTSG